MLHNMSGTFFHIDFGHFLGMGKSKLGFKRDREPFILSNELHYFLKNFCLIDIDEVKDAITTEKPPEKQKPEVAAGNIDFEALGMHLVLDNQVDPGLIDQPSQQVIPKTFKLFFNTQLSSDKKRQTNYKGPEYQEEVFEKLAS
mmetsp:Transcript_23740/g.31776  ORF Transcript_23740/g.31776 Transcript_23740/m.31776 type:complete len:143 (-) Transcript_23740:432-860(-)